MSRIKPSRPRGLLARLVFFFSRRMLGKVPTPVRVAANNPAILSGHAHMERAQQKAKTLPPALRSLVSLRVATLIGCPF